MGLADLSANDKELVRRCVKAAAEGSFFSDDEFHPLFGVERSVLQDLLADWPPDDAEGTDAALAINNAFANLLGYPHGRLPDVAAQVGASPTSLERLFRAWRGDSSITSRIATARKFGTVTCVVRASVPGAASREMGDLVLQENGLIPLGTNWISIDHSAALRTATRILHRDLAYKAEIMPPGDAAELARQLVDSASNPCEYLSNSHWSDDAGHAPSKSTARSWSPASSATFDAGVVCVGAALTAVLWVEDED